MTVSGIVVVYDSKMYDWNEIMKQTKWLQGGVGSHIEREIK